MLGSPGARIIKRQNLHSCVQYLSTQQIFIKCFTCMRSCGKPGKQGEQGALALPIKGRDCGKDRSSNKQVHREVSQDTCPSQGKVEGPCLQVADGVAQSTSHLCTYASSLMNTWGSVGNKLWLVSCVINRTGQLWASNVECRSGVPGPVCLSWGWLTQSQHMGGFRA